MEEFVKGLEFLGLIVLSVLVLEVLLPVVSSSWKDYIDKDE